MSEIEAVILPCMSGVLGAGLEVADESHPLDPPEWASVRVVMSEGMEEHLHNLDIASVATLHAWLGEWLKAHPPSLT